MSPLANFGFDGDRNVAAPGSPIQVTRAQFPANGWNVPKLDDLVRTERRQLPTVASETQQLSHDGARRFQRGQHSGIIRIMQGNAVSGLLNSQEVARRTECRRKGGERAVRVRLDPRPLFP